MPFPPQHWQVKQQPASPLPPSAQERQKTKHFSIPEGRGASPAAKGSPLERNNHQVSTLLSTKSTLGKAAAVEAAPQGSSQDKNSISLGHPTTAVWSSSCSAPAGHTKEDLTNPQQLISSSPIRPTAKSQPRRHFTPYLQAPGWQFLRKKRQDHCYPAHPKYICNSLSFPLVDQPLTLSAGSAFSKTPTCAHPN